MAKSMISLVLLALAALLVCVGTTHAADSFTELQQVQSAGVQPTPDGASPVSLDEIAYRPKTELDPGAAMITSAPRWANINGVPTAVRPEQSLHSGMMLPDGRGGYIWMGANTPMARPDPANDDARELRLKIRELAEQLLANEVGAGLGNSIVLPTSFVNQDNFEQTSSFGRFIAEQMFYEFNQRGVAVREYRQAPEIVSKKGDQEGDFMLTRGAGNVTINSQRAAVLVGTYYADKHSVFVQARLINGATGMVMRTAMVSFAMTQVTKKMVRNATATPLTAAPIGIRDFNATIQSTKASPVQYGQDVH